MLSFAGLPPTDELGHCVAAADMAAPVHRRAVERALAYAAAHRSEFMWPWGHEPHSNAHGVLDDGTWLFEQPMPAHSVANVHVEVAAAGRVATAAKWPRRPSTSGRGG